MNALRFLCRALKPCLNRPKAVVDRGYRWALERLGLDYEHHRFVNSVERFFRYLRRRTMSALEIMLQGIMNLNLFLNLFTLY